MVKNLRRRGVLYLPSAPPVRFVRAHSTPQVTWEFQDGSGPCGLEEQREKCAFVSREKSLGLTVLACLRAVGEFAVALGKKKKQLIFIKFSVKLASPST